MAESVIYNKLEGLRRCIDRIESKTPATADEFIDNYDLQVEYRFQYCHQTSFRLQTI
jgi:hypothetical protein